MDVRVDAHFVIGRGHAVCQDYALACASGSRGIAVVCDGCSSSPDSDVGARLIGLAAARELRAPAFDGRRMLRRADAIRRALALPLPALDATLLTLQADDDGAVVHAWGDGVVVGRRRDGTLEAHRIEYPSHAPAYPAYALDPARREAYVASGWAQRIVDGDACKHAGDGLDPVRLAFPRDAYDRVAIASDGVTAVHDRDGAPIPVEDVVAVLLRSSSTRGAFVQRRCRRFVGRDCDDRGWIPTDDLALAVAAWETRP